MNGPYDFNSWPIAPPGTKIAVHKKVDQRASFEYRGREGWYIGSSVEHYRCVRCYIPTTNSEIVVDSVEFIPEKIPVPSASTDFSLRQTARDLVDVLKHGNNSTLPTLQTGNKVKNAIVQIAKVFSREIIFQNQSNRSL